MIMSDAVPSRMVLLFAYENTYMHVASLFGLATAWPGKRLSTLVFHLTISFDDFTYVAYFISEVYIQYAIKLSHVTIT